MKQRLYHYVLLSVAVLFFFKPTINAQEDDLTELSFEELLNMEVFVASGDKGLTQRESPGIVTVISNEEIVKSGARDFIDVLRMIPGYFPELDISGLLGVGIRGNWANEGKVLVLIDGVELNDDLYASVSYGQHIPVDLIDRVEVIRGPGSSMYGGAAEFGVVSIITKSTDKKHELYTSVNYGTTFDAMARQNVNLFYGGNAGDVKYSLSGHVGTGNLSNADATDMWGEEYNLAKNNNSKQQSVFLNGNINVKGFDLRVISDQYISHTTYPSYNLDNYQTNFNSLFVDASYKWALKDGMSLTPKFSAKTQSPWNIPELTNNDGDRDSTFFNSLTSNKYIGGLKYNYDIGRLTFFVGADYEAISAKDNGEFGTFDGENETDYNNVVAYAQAYLTSSVGNFTLGGRFNNNSQYGSYFVPRIAYTKVFGDYHVKALFSQAVREPRVMNIAYNPDIKPEKTDVIELEAGAQLFENMSLTANIFDIKLKDAIVYSYDSNNESYGNYGNTHTRGFEFGGKYLYNKGFTQLSYSYSKIIDNDIADYQIYDNETNSEVIVDDQNLGFPLHKFYAIFSYTVLESLHISPSATVLGSRYGITSQDWNTGYFVYSKFDPYVLLNLSLAYDNLFVDGLNLSVSAFNLLNANYNYIEPYIGWETPIPGSSAELMVKLSYTFNK